MSSPSKTGRKRVDLRHEKLARELADDMKTGRYRPAKEVMEAAGYSRSVAEKSAKRTLASASFREVAESIGLTRETVAKVIQDAAQARVVVTFKGTARETDAPDHKTRLAAASLMGDFTGEKKTTVEVRSLNVNVDGDALRNALGLQP